MNWNKFFTGTPEHEDHESENETDSEDEEDITDSNGSVSTDKRPYFLGMRFNTFSMNNCSFRCIKYVFLTINSATFLAGLVGVVTSIWNLTDNRIMSRLIGQRFFMTTLLFTGLIASLVSLLGILGVLRGKKKFLNIYIFLFVLFFCIIFVSAILSFWILEEITKGIHKDMASAIESYQSSFSSREAWDNTHRYLKCCGMKSAKDWASYHVSIPKSCCSKSIQECLHMTEAVTYKLGCLRSAVLLLKSYVHVISVFALLTFLLMLLTFLFALCILTRMKMQSANQN